MASNSWRQVRIRDLGRVVTGQTPPGSDPTYYGDSVPFLTPSDMAGHRRVGNTARRLSARGAEKLAGRLVPRGVGVSCIGSQMGKSVLIDEPTVTNQQINSVVVDEQVADIHFVYYTLLTRRAELFNLGSGGSVTPLLNKSDFERLPFALPPRAEQQAIATILSAFDEKIELNRRFSETLEAMARALFKSWFVDFDPVRAKADGGVATLEGEVDSGFPSSFEVTAIGEVPLGWKVEPLADVVEASKGVSYSSAGLSPDGLPLHNLNSILEGGGYKYSGIKHYVGDYRQRHVVRPGDCIVAATEQGHDHLLVGHAALVPAIYPDGIISQDLLVVRPGAGSSLSPTYLYHLLNSRRMHDIISGYTNGTTVVHLAADAFKHPVVMVPPASVVASFDEYVRPLNARAELAVRETDTLAALRDALLPRLVSGELRVPDAERIAVEAGA